MVDCGVTLCEPVVATEPIVVRVADVALLLFQKRLVDWPCCIEEIVASRVHDGAVVVGVDVTVTTV
jgi:hypothetical protein